MRHLLVPIVVSFTLLALTGCATMVCDSTDSPESCMKKENDAWQSVATAMANASKPPGYQECEARAATFSRSELVVGQECETIPASATSNERQICRSLTETRIDADKYSAIMQQCQAELRRDARQQRKDDDKSILQPIDCEIYPNAAGCYGRKK